jgi:hypothetical protein
MKGLREFLEDIAFCLGAAIIFVIIAVVFYELHYLVQFLEPPSVRSSTPTWFHQLYVGIVTAGFLIIFIGGSVYTILDIRWAGGGNDHSNWS